MKLFLNLFLTYILLYAVVGIECLYGGKIAQEGELPYQVFVGGRESNSGCNGVILKARYVLTTASCGNLYGTIIVGTINRKQGGTIIDIEEKIKHPKFKDDVKYNQYNIALLRTDKAIQFSTFIQPARLPVYDKDQKLTNFTISGWGRTEVWMLTQF